MRTNVLSYHHTEVLYSYESTMRRYHTFVSPIAAVRMEPAERRRSPGEFAAARAVPRKRRKKTIKNKRKHSLLALARVLKHVDSLQRVMSLSRSSRRLFFHPSGVSLSLSRVSRRPSLRSSGVSPFRPCRRNRLRRRHRSLRRRRRCRRNRLRRRHRSLRRRRRRSRPMHRSLRRRRLLRRRRSRRLLRRKSRLPRRRRRRRRRGCQSHRRLRRRRLRLPDLPFRSLLRRR